MTPNPQVSIVVPTYKRPDLLPRALASIQAQTYPAFEVIISDDEPTPGPSWELASRMALSDPRFHIIRNPGPHGQAGNLNHAIRAAKAPYIKPVYDDDAILPACLERMLAAAHACPSASLIRCLTERHDADRPVRVEPLGARAICERIPQPLALTAMYLQDVEIGAPTQVLVKADAIRRDAWFPTHDRIRTGVDALWYMSLVRSGDIVLLNEPLAAHYQSGHESITSTTTSDALDAEFFLLREIQFAELKRTNATTRVPNLSTAKRVVKLQRALWRLASGERRRALLDMLTTPDPSAWIMTLRWLQRRRNPGSHQSIPRETILLPH